MRYRVQFFDENKWIDYASFDEVSLALDVARQLSQWLWVAIYDVERNTLQFVSR